MIVIGLVGRIGAGKSTVAARFAGHGAEVIDADAIAHDVLEEPDVRRQVVKRFGTTVLDGDGRIRRRALAELVFGPSPAHATALTALEAIVHPLVRRRIGALLAAARATDGPRVVVLDVPLLVQAGWAEVCDKIVVVECDEEVRRQRLAARRWTAAEQSYRDAAWNRRYAAAQIPAEKTVRVDASGDLAYTLTQVDRIWSGLPG